MASIIKVMVKMAGIIQYGLPLSITESRKCA